MNGIRASILKKLKSSIPHVPYLKHNQRILHLHASDASPPPPPPPPDPCRILRDLPVDGRLELAAAVNSNSSYTQPQDIIDVAELMSDLQEDDNQEFYLSSSDKENCRLPPSTTPPKEATASKKKHNQDNQNLQPRDPDAPSYRPPDLDSATLFDPELLAAFEKAVMEHMRSFEEAKSRARAFPMDEHDEEGQPHGGEQPPIKVPRTDNNEDHFDALAEFQYKCPPGGRESVVLYTTTLRGIRKTFEDCNGVRFLLESLKVRFSERDVSMHLEFREELWRVLEGRAIPPRLFIRGRYIGGADEVLGLHERGGLLPLLREVPVDRSAGGGSEACQGCGGVRFVMCWECNGSRKIYGEEDSGPVQCHHCNENGLVVCPICW